VRFRAVLAVGMALVAGACSRADAVRNGVATDEGIAAIALPEEQYRSMLKRGTVGTMSGPMYLATLGPKEGCDLLHQTVEKEVQRNLPQWRANLIAAHRDNVPADELAEAVQKSPRRARSMLEPYVPAIGSAMKAASGPLLRNSGIEVLSAMGDAAGKVDRASLDLQARERELAEIKRTRKICGVGLWQQQ
jgi:hypothetical protein